MYLDWLPIRCSGIRDRNPLPKDVIIEGEKIVKEDFYPVKGEKIISGNEVVELEEKINCTQMARLYISLLKIFEYDLAMEGNVSLMVEVLKGEFSKDGEEMTKDIFLKRCREMYFNLLNYKNILKDTEIRKDVKECEVGLKYISESEKNI